MGVREHQDAFDPSPVLASISSQTRLTSPFISSECLSQRSFLRVFFDPLLVSISFILDLLSQALRSTRRYWIAVAAYALPLVSADGDNSPVAGPGPTIPYQGSVPHLTLADTWRGNAQGKFTIGSWIQRGVKLRYGGNDELCYDSLIATLNSILNIRLAEYSGSAGVLSLLPTIGALLGAPTNEIWRLWTVIPFGGVLTMLLSFGGAILPIKIEDYERDLAKGNGLIGSIVSFRAPLHGEPDKNSLEAKVNALGEKLRQRMGQKVPRPNFSGTLAMGLSGMGALLLGAHASMGIVEQGGVIPWYCSCQWWMHLWYILVTITSIAENWSNLPFDQQWRLFVSDVPYRIEIQDGDDIMQQLSTQEDSVSRSLHRLSMLRAGTVLFHGSKVKTHAVNTVIIMVSVVAHDSTLNSLKRLFTKMSSIGVFVTGTAFFASVQLLALPMAIMVLTFILSAGVFGRGFANWIVTRIDREEPLIHIIVKDAREAHEVISRILELDHQSPHDGAMETGDSSDRLVQVEIGGHVFVKHRRVAKRSSLWVKMLGIMASPYDLRGVGVENKDHRVHKFGSEMAYHSKAATSVGEDYNGIHRYGPDILPYHSKAATSVLSPAESDLGKSQ